MSDKNIFIAAIDQEINDLDIAGYVKQEVHDLFEKLHYYKIKNIYENRDALKEYLFFLDNHSTKQIFALAHNDMSQEVPVADNVSWYVSQKGLDVIGHEHIHRKIWENNFNLSYIMQAVKGFLLLTADEFCNASPTRMSINRMIWQKQMSTLVEEKSDEKR